VPNNRPMRLKMKAKKSKNLKSLGKEKCFELTTEYVNGMNSTEW